MPQAESFEQAELMARSADSHFKDGLRHYRSKEYLKAAEYFTGAIQIDSGHATSYLWRGASLGRLGRYPEAINNYNTGIRYGTGAVVDSCQKEIRRIKELLKGNDRAWFSAATIPDCTALLSLEPNNPAGYCHRAKLYFQSGEIDKAIEDLTKAINLDPKNSAAYTDRAGLYLQKSLSELKEAYLQAKNGNIDKAAQDLNKAIRHDPLNIAARSTLGYIVQFYMKADGESENYNSLKEYYTQTIESLEEDRREKLKKEDELKNIESQLRQYIEFVGFYRKNAMFANQKLQEIEKDLEIAKENLGDTAKKLQEIKRDLQITEINIIDFYFKLGTCHYYAPEGKLKESLREALHCYNQITNIDSNYKKAADGMRDRCYEKLMGLKKL
jgi:tetratricopeptide (TPR) repeat protein